MSRSWLLLKRHGPDLMVLFAAAASVLGVALRQDAGRRTPPMSWLEMVVIAGVVLSLLARHRFPFLAPAALWLVCAALSFVDGRLIVHNDALFVAGMAASLLLGNLRSGRQARLGLVIVLGGAAVVVDNDPGHVEGDLVFTPLLFALGWVVGFALRERATQAEAAEERARLAERDREVAARVAVAEERGRIARELHDVVAHAVSVMVLQVGAVRHRMPEGDTDDREALRNVEQAGRAALSEMRRLLSAMRHDGDGLELLPHPGLADLDALVDEVRAAGLAVRVHRHGRAAVLPPGLDLSAYRIVQEGLTNALKHAHARCAEVEVGYEPDELLLEVRDDGSGGGPHDGDPGHGLLGVEERVKIYGGRMSAGSPATGGFVLRVRLPLDGDRP